MTGQEVAQQIAGQIEGPYKWYALLIIVSVITALVTHFVFKTFKWFLMLAAFGLILFYLWSQLLGDFKGDLPSIKKDINQQQTDLFKTIENKVYKP